MDNRAQSIGIARFFLSLGVGAALFWILTEITNPLFEYAGNHADASDQVAQNGHTWLQEAVQFFPAVVLFISLFGIVAYAVFSRQVVG